MKQPTEKELYEFLKDVDLSFPIPLSQKQDLLQFAKKLLTVATLVTVYQDDELVSLVAGYTENVVNNMAYISVVATKEKARKQGYGKRTVKEFIAISKKKGLKAVHLYTVPSNLGAVNLYKNIGFTELFLENEPRKEDLHLVYYISGGQK